MKFFFDLTLTNEIINKEMSKNHQKIGSNVDKICKLELIFLFNDMIEVKY